MVMRSSTVQALKQSNYWERYYDAATVARANALRTEHTVPSTGVRIHVDLYAQSDPAAPVVIYNHGGAGYCRFFAAFALALHARGYTVVLPDQRGQGYSEGDRADFTLGQCVQNIIDVAQWARARCQGPLYLGGESIGSGLAYNAVAAGAPADALLFHNLYDYSQLSDVLALSRLDPLRGVPGLPQLLAATLAGLARLLPGLRLPFHWFGRFERMVAHHDRDFYTTWRQDPVPQRYVSLRYVASCYNTPPAIPMAASRLPALVINPIHDEMVRPAVTRRNFERLGGPKQYAEIAYGHWATGSRFTEECATLVDEFVQQGVRPQ
jgi:alpha-beta hydrolase superfamily lysophospholipase